MNRTHGTRRTRARRGLSALAVAVVGAGLAACYPMTMTGPTTLDIDSARRIRVSFDCNADSTCTGKAKLRLGGTDSPTVSYRVAARRSGTITLTLTPAQVEVVPAGGERRALVRITESTPKAVARRDLEIKVRRSGPVEPPTSAAYRDRNWTPTAYDTCSAEFHRSFSVVGPDGKLYPSWHPPTAVDPATGQRCTFGHEHGDDPSTSDIYEWVTDFLNTSPQTSRGIPFGYVSEALDTYAANSGSVTRHEDNVGHKIIVADDVRLVSQSPRGYVRDEAGDPISCDFLIKVHQGSHSGDALINNAHELLYAVRCSDGTEVISSSMSTFGDANEFNRSCDGTLVPTAGSDLPDGDGGKRRIPDRTCVNRDVLVPAPQVSSIWSLYEVWESENRLRRADGTPLVHFDPWFGVRDPARAHAGGVNNSILDLVEVTDLTDTDGGRASGYPFDLIIDHEQTHGVELTKPDPASPFRGSARDFYLQSTTVTNTGGPTTWYTSPWGDQGRTTAAPGFVRQHISSSDNSSWPLLERRVFDLEKDHGAGQHVHAPN